MTFYMQLEFSDNGRTNYEFLKRQNFNKTKNNENLNIEIEVLADFL